MKLYNM